jgi:hypothetical protein
VDNKASKLDHHQIIKEYLNPVSYFSKDDGLIRYYRDLRNCHNW